MTNFESHKRVIRSEICAECERRRPHGTKVDPTQPLECEHDCGIFVHLPQLVQLAKLRDPMLADSAAANQAQGPAKAVCVLARATHH